MLRALPLAAAVACVLAPGHPESPFSGVPIGVAGTVVVVAILTLGWWARRHLPAGDTARRATVLLAAAVAGKLLLALVAPTSGWVGRYYGNAGFAAPLERSSDYPGIDGTRIDRAIDFTDTEFPVHFFNEHRYAHGFRRESTDPFSVHWTGYVHADGTGPIRLSVETRGSVRLTANGSPVIDLQSNAAVSREEAALTLQAGDHLVEVRYVKPAETEGVVRLLGIEDVSPWPHATWQRALRLPLRAAAWLLHLLAAAAITLWLAPAMVRKGREVRGEARRAPLSAAHDLVVPAVMAALVLQGCWKARHLIDHVWTLTGGDDWFEFESQARDILINGPMLTQGAIVGRGQPFFYYPGYTYFVALAHRVTGESIAGVIVVNFLLLALATVLVYRLARMLVGPTAALMALAWLLVLEQAAFTRYYTVTLLSENLFVFSAAATVLGLTLHSRDGRVQPLLWAAFSGGISSLTRPSIILLLPLAAAYVAIAGWRRGNTARGAVVALLFVSGWMAVISPATIRNYVMSGEPVLISSGQAATFINYNLPSGDVSHYRDAFQGTLVSAAVILVRMFVDHPMELLSNFGVKLGFSLGMVHWMGSASPHPELLLTSAAYFVAWWLVPAARTFESVPLHLFVLTHLATLLLTMPSNYGYRLLLPMYLFMPVFGGALLVRFLPRVLPRRAG